LSEDLIEASGLIWVWHAKPVFLGFEESAGLIWGYLLIANSINKFCIADLYKRVVVRGLADLNGAHLNFVGLAGLARGGGLLWAAGTEAGQKGKPKGKG
jgi:hypothetical protein